MKQEDKELLLKDLCARLPYGVIVHHKNVNQDFNLIAVFNDGRIGVSTLKENIGLTPTSINECKPYLRPMSSMTEEEQNEFDDFCVIDEEAWKGNGIVGYINQAKIITEAMDFLNQHHFDYRGLIEKGLALEAPEGMYEIS